jgi:hypothetical protein
MHAKVTSQAVVVSPTRQKAEQWWNWYQQAFVRDQELLARTCRGEAGIDGLTEPLSIDDLFAALTMPDTLGLEVPPTPGLDDGGFVIVRYAGQQQHDSMARFREYFLNDVFRADDLRFRTADDQSAFLRVMDQGQVFYLAEFVSRGGRRVSSALINAVFETVCRERIGEPATVLGKCLDAAQIGRCKNTNGNRPIKVLVESLGMEKIARCDQMRTLQLPEQFDHRAYGCEEPIRPTTATLTFALYMGDARRAVTALSAIRQEHQGRAGQG